MLRLLVVEDDPQIADFIVRGLREEGLVVEHARDGCASVLPQSKLEERSDWVSIDPEGGSYEELASSLSRH